MSVELPDEPGVAAERQVGLEALLERVEAKFLQTRDVGLQGALEAQVRERRPAPEGQGFV